MRLRGVISLGLALAVVANAALADAPRTSIRPMPKPGGASATSEYVVIYTNAPGVRESLRPRISPRSRYGAPAPIATPVASAPVIYSTARLAPSRSLRPVPRPSRGAAPAPSAAPAPVAAPPEVVAVSSGGRICRSRDIRGERLRDIRGEIRGCGVNNPVRVSSVSGVALNPPAVMDCDTAKALNEWVDEGVKPTIGRLGGGIAELRVVDDYSCRPRNNRPGAEISEHGRGKAIDIASFNLRNGVRIPVEGGWNDRVQGRLLKQMHREACGPFGTVLGPDADRYHQDHFHLDTASHGNGNYCR